MSSSLFLGFLSDNYSNFSTAPSHYPKQFLLFNAMCHIFPCYYSFAAVRDLSPLMRWLRDKRVAYNVARDVDGQN